MQHQVPPPEAVVEIVHLAEVDRRQHEGRDGRQKAVRQAQVDPAGQKLRQKRQDQSRHRDEDRQPVAAHQTDRRLDRKEKADAVQDKKRWRGHLAFLLGCA
ncbi:MAG: hypothetical protein ACLGIE_13270 [Alphaproteobacteria bacterium]